MVFVLWVWMVVGKEQSFSFSSPAVVGLVEWTGLYFPYTGENSCLDTHS